MADEHLVGDGDDVETAGAPPGGRSARTAADDSLVGDPSRRPHGAEEIEVANQTATEEQEDSDRVEFKEIGNGYRWYDPVYHLLRWLQYSWLGKRLPRSWRGRLYYASNYLLQYHEVERHRTLGERSERDQLSVPADEHVVVPAIWAVDFFSPSNIDDLKRAIRRNGWNDRPHIGMVEPSLEALERSRQGNGRIWWRIAEIASPKAGYFFPNGHRENLPDEFDAVEITGVPIGGSLTAVISYFHLSKSAMSSVDEVWHADHEAALARRKGRLVVAEGPMWVTFRRTQGSRQVLHDVARAWLSDRCPGLFAKARRQQPLMDLLLLECFDPTTGEEFERGYFDALRALGLTESHVSWITSADLPGLLLEPIDQDMSPGLKGPRTWGLWGKRDRVASDVQKIGMYGSEMNRAIASFVDDSMSMFVVRLGLGDLLQLLREQGAAMRDNARAQHGKFGRRDLKRLRNSFLTSSLDVSSIHADIRLFNHPQGRPDKEATFVIDYAPWLRRQLEEDGHTPRKPVNLNKDLRERQGKELEALVTFDRDYREILSTVASLGASIDSFKVQRYAIVIAIVSVAIALGSLWVTLAQLE